MLYGHGVMSSYSVDGSEYQGKVLYKYKALLNSVNITLETGVFGAFENPLRPPLPICSSSTRSAGELSLHVRNSIIRVLIRLCSDHPKGHNVVKSHPTNHNTFTLLQASTHVLSVCSLRPPPCG